MILLYFSQNGELEQVRGRLNKSLREKIKHEAEISTLTM